MTYMLKKLLLLFIAMIVTTTIAETYLIAGTWQYLMMQSLTLSIIIFFVYHFVVFQAKQKEKESQKADRILHQTNQEACHKRGLKKIK